ncbi:hypothetical protein TNCV_227221 [Trichonephila clavipes]|nr:hypothetical protein TNCV_227221 [Trichonephila clavipes]
MPRRLAAVIKARGGPTRYCPWLAASLGAEEDPPCRGRVESVHLKVLPLVWLHGERMPLKRGSKGPVPP